MKRKDILRGIGAAGLASLLPVSKTNAAYHKLKLNTGGTCVLIPTETAGPYPLDISSSAIPLRQDIRDTQDGQYTKVKLKIIGTANCLPMLNARVYIWHCNKDGYYSGYTTSAHLGSQNHSTENFLRGVQLTDANGEVEFITVFPGWYPGRTAHIHFTVYINSVLSATSQLTFPVAAKNSIYTTDAFYTTWGADPVDPANDGVFSDGYTNQLATMTLNSTTGGYDCYLEVGINGSGTVASALKEVEPETGGQFKLHQNFPNPYFDETTVPFSLANTSDVKIELYDLSGKKVAEVSNSNLAAGKNEIVINVKKLGIARGNYVYQFQAANNFGTYTQSKMMTAE